MKRSQQFMDGARWATKRAVEWLHHRANSMTDPKALHLLHGAATNLGWDSKELTEPMSKSETRINCTCDNYLAARGIHASWCPWEKARLAARPSPPVGEAGSELAKRLRKRAKAALVMCQADNADDAQLDLDAAALIEQMQSEREEDRLTIFMLNQYREQDKLELIDKSAIIEQMQERNARLKSMLDNATENHRLAENEIAALMEAIKAIEQEFRNSWHDEDGFI